MIHAMFDALTNRPWKRALLVIVVFFFLWVIVPWLLDVPPMDMSPGGAPFPAE